MKFIVYREMRRSQRSHELFRPEPKRVKAVEAENVEVAARTFVKDQLLGKGGWKDPVVETSFNGRTANVWLRRFTPTGRYKGETHFLVWPQP